MQGHPFLVHSTTGLSFFHLHLTSSQGRLVIFWEYRLFRSFRLSRRQKEGTLRFFQNIQFKKTTKAYKNSKKILGSRAFLNLKARTGNLASPEFFGMQV